MQLNIPSVSIVEAKTQILLALMAGETPFLWGPPGVGKSAILKQIANEAIYYIKEVDSKPEYKLTFTPNERLESEGWEKRQGIELIVEYLSTMDVMELRGIPQTDEQTRKTVWYPNERIPEEGVGIFFLDELSSVAAEKQVGVYSLLLEREIGGKKIPPGWVVAVAGNTPDCGAVYEPLSRATIDRTLHLNIIATLAAARNYAEIMSVEVTGMHGRKGIHPYVMAFLECNPEYLDNHESIIAEDKLVSVSPRTWLDKLSNILWTIDRLADGDDKTFSYLINNQYGPTLDGRLGKEVAAVFRASMDEIRNRPDLDTLLSDTVSRKEKEALLIKINSNLVLWGLMYAIQNRLTVDNAKEVPYVFEVMDILCSSKQLTKNLCIADTVTSLTLTLAKRHLKELFKMVLCPEKYPKAVQLISPILDKYKD